MRTIDTNNESLGVTMWPTWSVILNNKRLIELSSVPKSELNIL